MISQTLLEALGLFSLVTFVGSLIAVPWLIGRMRADFFLTHWQRVESRHRRHPLLALAILVLRNGFGLLLAVTGAAMLVLPGQGLLTILIALCVMDYPGKRRLLERIVRIPSIQHALNWVRCKRGKPEFVYPDSGDQN